MKVKLIRAEWAGVAKSIYVRGFLGTFQSVEDLPHWIQERYAVLRLLNEHEAVESPLGRWRISRDAIGTETLWLCIVPQPGDPEWEK